MDLQRFSRLRPSFDATTGVLALDLEHGKANEVGTAVLEAFEVLCATVEDDASILCVVVSSGRRSSKGVPLFIAGADVRERVGWSSERVMAHLERQRRLVLRWRSLPAFVVAIPNGAALGFGLEFCLACDYVLATREAFFALPETGLGIVPGAGGTALLAARIGTSQALRLGCTGERVDAEEAARLGLVDEIVDSVGHGHARVQGWSERLRERSPTAVVAFKRAILSGVGLPVEARLELEARAYAYALASGDAERGRAAFEAKETPCWNRRSIEGG